MQLAADGAQGKFLQYVKFAHLKWFMYCLEIDLAEALVFAPVVSTF